MCLKMAKTHKLAQESTAMNFQFVTTRIERPIRSSIVLDWTTESKGSPNVSIYQFKHQYAVPFITW